MSEVDETSAEFLALANEMIAENATKAVLQKPGAKTGDDSAPKKGTPVNTDVSIVPDVQKQSDKGGSLIGKDVRKYLFSAAAGVAPQKADKLAINTTVAGITSATKWFEIMAIEPVSLGATDIVYTIWIEA